MSEPASSTSPPPQATPQRNSEKSPPKLITVAYLFTGAVGLPFAILFSLLAVGWLDSATVPITLGYWSMGFMFLTTGVNLIAVIPAIILCVKFSDSLRIFLPAASFLFLVAVTVVAFATEDDAFYAVALMVYCLPACLTGLGWAIRTARARLS